MNFPVLNNIVDLVALQNAVALLLCSDDRLATIPILPELKLNMDSDVVVDVLWTLPRSAIAIRPDTVDLFSVVVDGEPPTVSGPTGAGLLVEMPEGRVISRGLEGPPFAWKIRIVAFEERNTNLTRDVGTFIMAEQLAQLAIDILQLQNIYPFGTLAAVGNSVAPARDWQEMKPGIACWSATLEVENGRKQTPRSAATRITFDAGMCTITCTDAAAEIRYTTDNSTACKANPSALIYGAPFPVNIGTVVKASSWKPGYLPSSVVGQVAP